MIDKYNVREFNTLRYFAEANSGPIKISGATAESFADIDYGIPQRKFLNLPDENVQGLRMILQQKGAFCKVDSGQEATEDKLKSLNGNSPTILQITTHGFSLK